jgi:FKBP-type peptidyl-prolyl cis-trans isomerase (trigger factor)
LAEQESIEISASEVDNKIEEIVGDAEDKEKVRQFFSLPQFRRSIEQSLRSQRTIDHLLQIAVGDTEDMKKGE